MNLMISVFVPNPEPPSYDNCLGLGCHHRPLRTENYYESARIGKENLRQMQDHPPQGSSAGDLRKLETQTASRLKTGATWHESQA
jgi:hypothetical protein